MSRNFLVFAAVLSVSCGGSADVPAEAARTEGEKDGPCYPNSTCNAGLSCVASFCRENVDAAQPVDAASETAVEDVADAPRKPPYALATVTGACDESMLADVAGASGDDTVSSKSALPFAFRYFGDAVSHWSMSSNGFAQLWPSGDGAGDKNPENVAIGGLAAPNGHIAAFWDDLAPVYSNSRAGVLGAAPNRRFVISWVHWTIKGQTDTVRVTFQVKLFETTNAIELHYCGMAPAENAFATGSSATIGLENLSGTEGMQLSFNTPSAVASGKAYRFTP